MATTALAAGALVANVGKNLELSSRKPTESLAPKSEYQNREDVRFREESKIVQAQTGQTRMSEASVRAINDQRTQMSAQELALYRQQGRERRTTRTSSARVIHYVDSPTPIPTSASASASTTSTTTTTTTTASPTPARVTHPPHTHDLSYALWSGHGAGAGDPQFNCYADFDFTVRRDNLKQFVLAAHKAIVANRIARRIALIRERVLLPKQAARGTAPRSDAMMTATSTAAATTTTSTTIGVAAVSRQSVDAGDVSAATAVRPELINPYRLARFVTQNGSSRLYKPVDVPVYSQTEELVLCSLTEPQEYKLLGYHPHPTPPPGSYSSLERHRAMREGAFEDISVRPVREAAALKSAARGTRAGPSAPVVLAASASAAATAPTAGRASPQPTAIGSRAATTSTAATATATALQPQPATKGLSAGAALAAVSAPRPLMSSSSTTSLDPAAAAAAAAATQDTTPAPLSVPPTPIAEKPFKFTTIKLGSSRQYVAACPLLETDESHRLQTSVAPPQGPIVPALAFSTALTLSDVPDALPHVRDMNPVLIVQPPPLMSAPDTQDLPHDVPDDDPDIDARLAAYALAHAAAPLVATPPATSRAAIDALPLPEYNTQHIYFRPHKTSAAG